MKPYLLYPFLLAFCLATFAQSSETDWKLSKTSEEVEVFTRKLQGEKFSEFKALMTINADANQVMSLIRDVDSNPKWMDKVQSSKLIKKISDNEYYYYSEIDAPWPIADRDMVIHVKIEKTGEGYLMHLSNAADYLPQKKSFIRIPRFRALWTLKEMPDGQLNITQQGFSAVGGDVPDWMADAAVVDSPLQTMVNLRKLLAGE